MSMLLGWHLSGWGYSKTIATIMHAREKSCGFFPNPVESGERLLRFWSTSSFAVNASSTKNPAFLEPDRLLPLQSSFLFRFLFGICSDVHQYGQWFPEWSCDFWRTPKFTSGSSMWQGLQLELHGGVRDRSALERQQNPQWNFRQSGDLQYSSPWGVRRRTWERGDPEPWGASCLWKSSLK